MPLTTGKRPWRRFGIAALIGMSALAIASATQAATCNTSTSELVFGIYDTFSTLPTDSATDIAVQCDAEAAYVASLSAGFGSSGARRMQGSTGGALQYGLYTDPARLTAWGWNGRNRHGERYGGQRPGSGGAAHRLWAHPGTAERPGGQLPRRCDHHGELLSRHPP